MIGTMIAFSTGYIFGGVVCHYIEKDSKNKGGNSDYHIDYETKTIYMGKQKYNAILKTRKEAKDVLSYLDKCIHDYTFSTVSDLKDFCGDCNSTFEDNKVGWTDLSKAIIQKTRSGYLLELPEPMSIMEV